MAVSLLRNLAGKGEHFIVYLKIYWIFIMLIGICAEVYVIKGGCERDYKVSTDNLWFIDWNYFGVHFVRPNLVL